MGASTAVAWIGTVVPMDGPSRAKEPQGDTNGEGTKSDSTHPVTKS